MTVILIGVGILGKVRKGIGPVGNWKNNGDHSDYRMVEMGKNTQVSPADQIKLTVTDSIDNSPAKTGVKTCRE